MAKKVRRVKKKQQKREAAQPAVAKAAAVETSGEATDAQHPPVDQFQVEYAYVIKDLSRVFILAAAMFALLIAVNLLLQ